MPLGAPELERANVPRRERPLDRAAGPVQAFADDLRRLREDAGSPKYLQMARQTGKSRTALAEAAGGDHLPMWETVHAYVTGCGGVPAEWLPRWEAVHEYVKGAAREVEVVTRTPDPRPIHPPPAQGEILMQLWQEQRNQARQLENQRALFCCLIVLLAAISAVIAVLAADPRTALAARVMIPVFGGFGALAATKFYERHQMHMSAAETIRRRLNELFPHLRIESDWAESRARHHLRYRWLYHLRLHHLWVVFNLLVAGAGLAYLTAAR